MSNTFKLALFSFLLGACAVEATDDVSSDTQSIESDNRIAVNRIAVNRIAVNRIAVNRIAVNGLSTLEPGSELMDTQDGRDVYAYLIQCALPAGQTVTGTASDSTVYTFEGAIGLAPAWADRAPTIPERRWVSACLLARSNHFGVSVELSLRGASAALATDATEEATFTVHEGNFYGDLFADTVAWNACSSLTATDYAAGGLAERRVCSSSQNGTSTQCEYEYTGACSTACVSGSCSSSTGAYSEVISVYLRPGSN